MLTRHSVRWQSPWGTEGEDSFTLPSAAGEYALMLGALGYIVFCQRVMLPEPERETQAEGN